MKKQISILHYDENGYSKQTFTKDDYKVRIRIDERNSMVYIVRDDNLLVLFKKKVNSTNPAMMKKRAKMWIAKFCNIVFIRQRKFNRKGSNNLGNNNKR